MSRAKNSAMAKTNYYGIFNNSDEYWILMGFTMTTTMYFIAQCRFYKYVNNECFEFDCRMEI